MSSSVEDRADNAARAAGLLVLERPGEDLEDGQASRGQAGWSRIAVLCMCALAAELAESQPQVLKWAPASAPKVMLCDVTTRTPDPF